MKKVVLFTVAACLLVSCGGSEAIMFTNERDNEWGSTQAIPPAPGGAALGAIGKPVRLVYLSGEAKDSEIVTVGVSAISPIDPATGTIFNPGPLVGLVDFGNGNATSRMEFDVVPQADFPLLGQGQSIGGTLVNVPASSIQVYLRNDANMIPVAGDDPIGNGAAVRIPQGSGWAAYGRNGGRVTRTVYWLRRLASVATPITRRCGIPPFARSFQVYARNLAGVAADVTVDMVDAGGFTVQQFTIPAATPFPPVMTVGTAVSMDITIAAGPGATSGMTIFDIENCEGWGVG